MARASGINWDLRVNRPSMAYREVPVQVQVRQEGDCYARNAVRTYLIKTSDTPVGTHLWQKTPLVRTR